MEAIAVSKHILYIDTCMDGWYVLFTYLYVYTYAPSFFQELTSFFHAGGDGISPEKMNSDEYKV